MVTNYPQQLSASTEVTPSTTAENGIVGRLFTRVGQVLCGTHYIDRFNGEASVHY